MTHDSLSVPERIQKAVIPVVLPGILLGVWLAAGLGLVPALLEGAFRGSGPGFLSAALAAHPEVTLGDLLAEWYGIVLAGTGAIVFLSAMAYVLRRSDYADRFVGKASPADVGAIRILVCAVLLISVLWEDLASTASLPKEMIRPMGVIQLLFLIPGFDRFLASESALSLFEWATAALLVLGMVGWKTRVVLPMGAASYLILGGILRQYAWFYHTGLLALYLLLVLSVLPSHHGCSVDRLIKLWKGDVVNPATATRRYGWMRYALWSTLAIPYVVAGLSKLRNGGLTWWEASNFKFILYQSTLRPMEFDFNGSLMLTSAPDAVFEVLAISAVGGEILYGLVLFSRRARWIMPSVMALMHVGILFFQNILFFDLILLQAVFFNFRPLVHRIRDARARHLGRLQVVYDGTLARHRQSMRLISALDVLDRIEWQQHDGSGRMVAHDQGRTYSGDSLYRRVAISLPLLWCVPVVLIPDVARRLGRVLSTRDFKMSHEAAPRAPIDSVRLGAHALDRAGPRSLSWTGGPRFTMGLASLLCVFWVFRVEFYPFTGMQMFSNKRTEPVTYERVLARLGSDEVIRAPVEKCIGAMSDSRYRRVIQMAFVPERLPLAAAFLDSCRVRWNGRVQHPSERIESFEVQQWEWYYLRDPQDSNFGKLIDRKTFAVRDSGRLLMSESD